jgi:phosphohistidine phosphatase
MELYLLRHGKAEDRAPGKNDAGRKLTPKGKIDVRATLTLAKLDPQRIFTSPLRRAKETAAIASELFPHCPVTITDALLPTAEPAAIWKEVCSDPKLSRALLAGHEPHLGQTIAYLLAAPVSVDLKKGALVRINSPRRDRPQGVLKWMITPRLARVS